MYRIPNDQLAHTYRAAAVKLDELNRPAEVNRTGACMAIVVAATGVNTFLEAINVSRRSPNVYLAQRLLSHVFADSTNPLGDRLYYFDGEAAHPLRQLALSFLADAVEAGDMDELIDELMGEGE